MKNHILYICAMATLMLPSLANSEAFCALRDPTTSISLLEPSSSTHRSIVRTIDQKIRNDMLQKLPSLPLHFGELGKHTLYVALNKSEPVGLVHVRSEQSQWGLVEIAWSMDMNLRIKDFKFQRARTKLKKHLNQPDFKALLQGKNLNEVLLYLDKNTGQPTADYLAKAQGAESLAKVVLRCAIKTLMVTKLAWKSELAEFNKDPVIKTFFDNANIQPAQQKISDETLAELNQTFNNAELGIDRNLSQAYEIVDDKNEILAVLYVSHSNINDRWVDINWLIDKNNKIVTVFTHDKTLQDSEKALFKNTIGKSYQSTDSCNNRAELYALDAVITAKQYFK